MATEILSVGIDIGTSTTQVVFSLLTVENTSSAFTVPRVDIVDKRVVYAGEIHTTPLATATLLDGEGVRALVEQEYKKAGYRPQDVKTGAVIITGESARKENSRLVLDKLRSFAGDFVVSTAGPDLESVIAGKGSGAYRYSMEHSCTVVNLDIGGGTTNIVLFDSGEVIAKGCLDIGGRLIRLSSEGKVLAISPSAARVAAACGTPLAMGDRPSQEALSHIAGRMALLLEQLLGICEPEPLLEATQTGGSTQFASPKKICAICFSGGVANLVYRAEDDLLRYGDFGVYLGRAIRESRLLTAFTVVEPTETIRATVVGAGSYTTALSGSTIYFSGNIFPLQSVPVLKLDSAEEAACFGGDGSLLEQRVQWFLEQSDATGLVLSAKGKKNPDYSELKRFAAVLAGGLDSRLPPGAPLLVAVECDIAKALGQLIWAALGGRRQLCCIDSVHMEQGDYLDFGAPLMDGLVIPVVVKTLIFG
ncbi:MAG: ethanolamine ammonia-lyase reactivating factor EutA [Angelakisella sp.]